MSFYFVFDKSKNYIGNAEWQYKYTSWIAKRFPEINFTSGKHDMHIASSFAEKNHIIRTVSLLMYDLIFLVLGCLRLFLHPKQWIGMPIHIGLYLILLFSTVYRVIKDRKRFTDLSLPKKNGTPNN